MSAPLFDGRDRDGVIRELRAAGMNLRAIAVRVGVSKGTVNRAIYGYSKQQQREKAAARRHPWCPACRCAHDPTRTPCPSRDDAEPIARGGVSPSGADEPGETP